MDVNTHGVSLGAQSARPTPRVKQDDRPMFEGKQGVADAGGICRITFDGPRTGFFWFIDRISIEGGGSFELFRGQDAPANRVDFTANGTDNIADQAQPIYIPGGTPVVAKFSGAGAGTVCTVNLQGRNKQDGSF